MSFKDLLHKLNRRDTRLLPNFSFITKVIFIFIFVFGLISVTHYIFAATTINEHQQILEERNPSLELWQDESGNNEIFGALRKVIGDIKIGDDGSLVSWNFKDSLFSGTTKAISYLYTPAASGIQYIAYSWNNFLGTKNAYAADNDKFSYGYDGLMPILPIWKHFRDAVYTLYSIFFIIIGFMIILRVKVSPQAVVTIQNTIPQLIITLILITFSYAIAGLLIDLSVVIQGLFVTIIYGEQNSWAGNLVNTVNNFFDKFKNIPLLSIISKLYKALIGDTVMSMVPSIESYTRPTFFTTISLVMIPIFVIALVTGLVLAIISAIFSIFAPGTSFVVGGVTYAVILLIAIVIVLIWLIKFLFGLFKCYTTVIFKIVVGPLEIALGAFPNSKVGFSSWFWGIVSNLAVFPISFCFLLLGNSIITTLLGDTAKGALRAIVQFIIGGEGTVGLWAPSMIGGDGVSSSTIVLLAFSVSLLSIMSKLPDLIPQYIFNIKPSPWGQAIGQGMGEANKFVGGVTTTGLQVTSGFEEKRYAAKTQTPRGPSRTDTLIHGIYDSLGAMKKIKR